MKRDLNGPRLRKIIFTPITALKLYGLTVLPAIVTKYKIQVKVLSRRNSRVKRCLLMWVNNFAGRC